MRLLFEKTSYDELLAIEDYLIKNGLEVVEDGKLHEMFYMTGYEIREKYGFNKSELIDFYMLNQSERKKK